MRTAAPPGSARICRSIRTHAILELGLAAELLRAIAEEGYTEPTPVQSQGIPPILRGQDVMAGAQTGTGKTAAFTLPMLQKLKQHANTSVSPARHPVRALIITPTRELAAQVFESIRTYGKYIPLRSAVRLRRRSTSIRRLPNCAPVSRSWWRPRGACSTTCTSAP